MSKSLLGLILGCLLVVGNGSERTPRMMVRTGADIGYEGQIEGSSPTTTIHDLVMSDHVAKKYTENTPRNDSEEGGLRFVCDITGWKMSKDGCHGKWLVLYLQDTATKQIIKGEIPDPNNCCVMLDSLLSKHYDSDRWYFKEVWDSRKQKKLRATVYGYSFHSAGRKRPVQISPIVHIEYHRYWQNP